MNLKITNPSENVEKLKDKCFPVLCCVIHNDNKVTKEYKSFYYLRIVSKKETENPKKSMKSSMRDMEKEFKPDHTGKKACNYRPKYKDGKKYVFKYDFYVNDAELLENNLKEYQETFSDDDKCSSYYRICEDFERIILGAQEETKKQYQVHIMPKVEDKKK